MNTLPKMHPRKPFKPNYPWLSPHTKRIKKPYILEHLDNIKLSISKYIATSINYGSYIDNMFAFEQLDYNFHKQFINVKNLKPPARFDTETPMSKPNQTLLDRYRDMTFLLEQNNKTKILIMLESY